MSLVARVAERFTTITGHAPIGVWAAPGRVNIIGEHTDYNDGFALPMAIDRHTVVAVGQRTDGRVRVGSTLSDEIVELALEDCVPGKVSGWAAYPLGVVWALGGSEQGRGGLDIVIDTDVPIGAGLSSSAAIECAVAVAVNDLWELGHTTMDLAKAGQRAENQMVGAPTGLMDQIASMHGKPDSLVFIDCRNLTAEVVPFALAANDLAVLVMNSRVHHSHATGGYGERRAACERAAAALEVAALRDVTVEMLPRLRELTDDETFRRARHVVTENARVEDTVAALRESGPTAIGDLLYASHLSMRDDFEISVPQIDVAVETALENGALGARLTGGGFGGAAIALAPHDALDSIETAVRGAYAKNGFDSPEMFVVAPSQGAARIS
ncbi:MAG: galactokinase [Actinomycetota bacterium]